MAHTLALVEKPKNLVLKAFVQHEASEIFRIVPWVLVPKNLAFGIQVQKTYRFGAQPKM